MSAVYATHDQLEAILGASASIKQKEKCLLGIEIEEYNLNNENNIVD